MSLNRQDFVILVIILCFSAFLTALWVSGIQYEPLTLKENNLNGSHFKRFSINGNQNFNPIWYGVTFIKGRIENSNFAGASIENTVFENVDLTGVKFTRAIFKKCIFKNVKMEDVSFHSAQLIDVKFEKSTCNLCDLRNTRVTETQMDIDFHDSFYNEKSLLPFSWNQLEAKGFQYRP